MRAHAASLFFYSRMTHLTSFVRSMWRRDLPILTYHRVCTVEEEARYPFDIELVSASVSDFTWQMEYISRHFTPITFGYFIKAARGEALLPAQPIIVTFDDGFADNYENAYPILKRLSIPATIFLAADYIGRSQTFWYDRLAYLINKVPPCTWNIPELELILQISGEVSARRPALHLLLERMKSVPNETRLKVLSRVDKVWGHLCEGPDLALSRPLDWEQVREMSADGIEFGSHTLTHPILTKLDDETLQHELQESRRLIESHVKQKVEVIAYPVGRRFAFDVRVISAAQSAGYQLGVSCVRGTNRLESLDPFCIKRLVVERFIDRAQYAATLSLPEVFSA